MRDAEFSSRDGQQRAPSSCSPVATKLLGRGRNHVSPAAIRIFMPGQTGSKRGQLLYFRRRKNSMAQAVLAAPGGAEFDHKSPRTPKIARARRRLSLREVLQVHHSRQPTVSREQCHAHPHRNDERLIILLAADAR